MVDPDKSNLSDKIKQAYWEYQFLLGKNYLIPLLNDWSVIPAGKKVLDIGCGEGGLLCALTEAGASGIGVDISSARLVKARKFANSNHLQHLQFITADFFSSPLKDESQKFDIILLRDVLEHLPDKQKVMKKLHDLMGAKSRLFITFPPFYSPFGGHQQILQSWLKYIPYFHALPTPLWLFFRWLIKNFDGNTGYLKEAEKLRKHRISMGLFIKSTKIHGFKIVANRNYISRPSHRLRYGLPVIISNHLGRIPVLREIFITGAFYLLARE